MEKNEKFLSIRGKYFPSCKILRIMKLVFLFVLIGTLHLSAGVYSQTKKLNLNLKNVSLKQVLEELEKQTDMTFLYSDSNLDVNKAVTVVAHDKSLEQILDNLFKGKPIHYSMIENHVIITVKESPESYSVDQQQKYEVTGKVTDDKGEPLAGVNVYTRSQRHGVITKSDGTYSVVVDGPDDVLEFTFIGYANQEVNVAGRHEINITLVEKTVNLDEVVTTALSIDRAKRSIGYSLQKIKGTDIAESNEVNVLDAIQGRVAGVQVIQHDGLPGGTTSIIIRGNNNIGKDRSDQPLFVVDGIPIVNDDVNISGQGQDWGSGINAINADDIESMVVLKGANAAALYGARAANGVILITTKKGKKGKGVGVQYSYTWKVDDVFKARDVQNIWGAGYTYYLPKDEAFPKGTDNDGNEFYKVPSVSYWGSGASWGPKMDGTMVQWYDKVMRPFDPQPNNILEPYQKGISNTHSISFSGGSDKATFRAAVTNLNTTSIYPNTDYKRLNLSFAGSVNLSKRLRADISMNYAKLDQMNTARLGDNGNGFGKALLYNWARSEKVALRMENYKNPNGSRNNDYRYGRDGNILWNILETFDNRLSDRYIGSFSVNWDITDWLSLMLRGGIDNNYTERDYKQNPWDVERLHGAYIHGLGKDKSYQTDFLFTFNKDIGSNFNISANLGGSDWYRKKYNISTRWYNKFSNPDLYAIANYDGNPKNPTEGFYEKEIMGLYGTVDLAFKNYLFLQLTGRNDWSSTLPQDNNSYFYPSVSTSFVFSDAFTMPQWLTMGKVRASYAMASVDDSPYQLQPTYKIGSWYGYSWASIPGTIPPANLKPQNTSSFEIGADFGVWHDRFNASLTYYHKKSTDQILSGPVALTSGFSAKRYNTGSMQNTGFEMTLDVTPVMVQGFKWQVVFNYYINHNKILNLDDEGGVEVYKIDGIWGSNGPSIEAKKGEAYGTIMGWDFLYDEQTGKRLVDERGWPYTTNQKVAVGNSMPKWFGGLINTLTWKGINLNMIWDIKIGGDMWFGTKAVADGFGQSPVTIAGRDKEHGGLHWTDDSGRERDDGVIFDGIVATDVAWNDETQKYDYTRVGENTTVMPARYYWALKSSGWGAGAPTTDAIYENSWVRITELSLGYSLPRRLLTKMYIQNLSFNLFARNLGYIMKTAPDNISPNGGLNPGKAQGIEFSSLPLTRQFGINLKIAF